MSNIEEQYQYNDVAKPEFDRHNYMIHIKNHPHEVDDAGKFMFQDINSLYISNVPRDFCSEEKLKDLVQDVFRIGAVKRVDIVCKKMDNGQIRHIAFIHFHYWTINENTDWMLECIRTNKKCDIYGYFDKHNDPHCFKDSYQKHIYIRFTNNHSPIPETELNVHQLADLLTQAEKTILAQEATIAEQTAKIAELLAKIDAFEVAKSATVEVKSLNEFDDYNEKLKKEFYSYYCIDGYSPESTILPQYTRAFENFKQTTTQAKISKLETYLEIFIDSGKEISLKPTSNWDEFVASLGNQYHEPVPKKLTLADLSTDKPVNSSIQGNRIQIAFPESGIPTYTKKE